MTAIRPSDLARHWDTQPSYVSMLRARKAMPEFETYEAADSWRAVNAPPKRRAPRSDQTSTTSSENSPGVFEHNNNRAKRPPAENIDTTKFLAAPGTDFEELMLRQAEEVAQVAHGLYMRACSGGNAGEIAAHLKNWSDAVSRSKDLREKFLELQERSRLLISIDTVMDIVGRQLQALRLALTGQGERIAIDANPGDPVLAKRVIDADGDSILASITATASAVTEEMQAA